MHQIQQQILNLSSHKDISKIGYRKIGQLIGEDHPQKVKHHLSQLIKKGHIKLNKNTNFIDTLKRANLAAPTFSDIPLYGSANCGIATFIAEDKIEGYVRISNSLLINKRVIALKAAGNSMNKANINGLSINDGDYVLVNTYNKMPNSGDYVLSIIDNCANIKKFIQKNNDQIILVSESSENIPPIYISQSDSYLINGVVTQIIKN